MQFERFSGLRSGRAVRHFASTLSSAALVYAIGQSIVSGSAAAPVAILLESPAAFAANVAMVMIVAQLFGAITGRGYVGLALVAIAYLSLAYVSFEKTKVLGEPLYPWDFLFAKQVVNLVPALFAGATTSERLFFGLAVALAVACLAGLVWLTIRSQRMPPSIRARKAIGASLAFVGMGFAFSPSMQGKLYQFTGIRNMSWDQPLNYKRNGFPLAFALNLNSGLVFAPAGYSPSAFSKSSAHASMQAVTSRPKRLPDIVVIMSEAFWDPTRLNGLKFERDPLSVMRNPPGRHRLGTLLTPSIFGLTANVEFEALTGLSQSHLPMGSVPYQQYLRQNMPSVPRFLKANGYRTLAIHPYPRWFWNRDAVYKRLGFDAFIDIADMPALPKRGTYAGDAGLMTEIARRLDGEGPAFVFAITMQNHAPYPAALYGPDQLKADGTLPAHDLAAVSTYAQGIADADAALGQLLTALQKRPEPTIVVFFGDHLPYLGAGGSTFIKTGYIEQPEDPSVADHVRMHTTPLLVWTNYDVAIPNFSTISPIYLPYIITKMAGLSHPLFTGELGGLFAAVPGIERRVVIDASGRATDIKNETQHSKLAEHLHRHKMIQYDILFGDRFGKNALFCEVPPETCSVR